MNTASADRAPHPGWYHLRVKGHLAPRWAARFDAMMLTPQDDGTTLIQGPVVDQAALHGLLQQVRDTGLPLVSLVQINSAQVGPDQSDIPPISPAKQAPPIEGEPS
jgi:hypothetical protein